MVSHYSLREKFSLNFRRFIKRFWVQFADDQAYMLSFDLRSQSALRLGEEIQPHQAWLFNRKISCVLQARSCRADYYTLYPPIDAPHGARHA